MRRDSNLVDAPNAEVRAERRQLLAEMLESRAWREVCEPAIRSKLAAIERLLATSERMTIEEIRGQQWRWKVLAALLEHPKSFLGED